MTREHLQTMFQKGYNLLEAVADIAYKAGVHKYYSGDSRQDMRDFIIWAKEFETIHADTIWEDSDMDYMIEIEHFTQNKLKEYDIHAQQNRHRK